MPGEHASDGALFISYRALKKKHKCFIFRQGETPAGRGFVKAEKPQATKYMSSMRETTTSSVTPKQLS